MQPSAQQLLVSVYCERKEKGGGGGALGGGLRLLKGAAAPERVSLGGFSLQPGRWHHLLLCFRKGKLLGGKSEALAYVDGARAQATHCAYPQLLPDAASSSAADAGGERDSAAAARLSFRVGAFDERRGFQGELGTIVVLRGFPNDGEAAALFRAGTRCAEPEAALATASSGLLQSASSTLVAAYDPAMADGGVARPIFGGASRAASLPKGAAAGVCVLRPLEATAAGPLPLLPLIELVHSSSPLPPSRLALLLAKVLQVLTALLRASAVGRVEFQRANGVGMVAHLLGRCAPPLLSEDLLAALCLLDASLEGYGELSDALLLQVFVRMPLWAKASQRVVEQLMRQLARLAAERPEQWGRTAALCRLLDAMCEAYPRPFAPAPATLAPSSGGGRNSPTPGGDDRTLRGLWAMFMKVMSAAADTTAGVPLPALRYLVHGMLRTGNAGVQAALLRLLLARTCASDLRIIEALLSGGDASLLHALLPLLQPDGAAAATALLPPRPAGAPTRSAADAQHLRVLLLRLLGRVAALGAPPATARPAHLPAAARWLSTAWGGRGGWAWLTAALLGASADEAVVEALNQLLLNTAPARAEPLCIDDDDFSVGAAVVVPSAAAADASGAGPDIDVEDEQAAKFVHAQARICPEYAPSIYMGRIYAAPANFEIQIHIYGVWIPQFAGVAYIRHIYGPHICPTIYMPHPACSPRRCCCRCCGCARRRRLTSSSSSSSTSRSGSAIPRTTPTTGCSRSSSAGSSRSASC